MKAKVVRIVLSDLLSDPSAKGDLPLHSPAVMWQEQYLGSSPTLKMNSLPSLLCLMGWERVAGNALHAVVDRPLN